jgi:hypothetical protein
MQAYENVRKDKTYEEFMKNYKLHIEGKVDPNIRCADRPETAPFDPAKLRLRKPKASANPYEEEEKAELRKLMAKGGAALSSQFSSKKTSPKNPDDPSEELSVDPKDAQAEKFHTNATGASKKDDLGYECKLEILKTNIVEELDDDYVLIAHPFPQMEGEMILF